VKITRIGQKAKGEGLRAKKRDKIVTGFIMAVTFTICHLPFAVSLAFAAEGGGEHGGSAMEWIWRLVNFGILVFVLVKFAGKPMKDFFQQRKALIEKSIQEAQEAKALAAKALAEVEERLKLKDKEIEEIKAASVSSGEREKTRLIEEGERLSTRILEQAKSNIDYEVKKAKDVIRAEAVEAAMRLAEEKIKAKMTREDQDRLLQETLKLLEGKN